MQDCKRELGECRIYLMNILDGKLISENILDTISNEIFQLKNAEKKTPRLDIILVGNDYGSEKYVGMKEKVGEEVGIKVVVHRLEQMVNTLEVVNLIDGLDKDTEVDGYMVQLPLPDHINTNLVLDAIDPQKDVDGFHPINVGRMAIGLPCYISATPNGILELFRRYHIETAGKKCVVLGRSNIVGKPMAILMMQKTYPGDATVTVCHSHSHNLVQECQAADIIISAIGQPHFIKADMVKQGAVVIDVGTTRVPSTKTKSG